MIRTRPSAAHHEITDRDLLEVLDGLRASTKRLPCKFLYDARGAELFERICTLEEYYPTRNELALLEQHLPEIAGVVGPRARVIEPGSGSGRKTSRLLASLDRPAVYVPIDVSEEQLAETALALGRAFPDLAVTPMHGDYTQLQLAREPHLAGRTVVFFPGSTIGNFEPDHARAFLEDLGDLAGPNALLVLGADSNSNIDALLAAYDDRDGVTSAFDLNLLVHLNRRFAATFDPGAFRHRAIWNAARSRIEMHLVSARRQAVVVGGHRFELARGESIVTEHCYKHAPATIAALLDTAGWRLRASFADPNGWMRLWLAERV